MPVTTFFQRYKTQLYFPLWRYSRPTWTRSCAASSRWPCFSGGVDYM